MDIKSLFEWFRNSYRWQELIPVDLQPGHDKLLVITGENASGKSILRRILQSLAKKENCEAIAISPEFRQHGGIANAFVFGDESHDASGHLACGMVVGSMRTSKARTNPHIIVLDEPDMGMSDNASAGAALAISQFCCDPSPQLGFFSIITHRKAMLEQFLALQPSHIRVGDTATLKQVVEAPIVPIAPGDVVAKGHALFLEMNKVLKTK